jgi:hypothetical protein
MHLGHHYFWWHWRDAGLEGLSMNREDIVRMAKEVGMESFDICVELDDFAKLVAEHEREACAKIAETPIGEYEVVVACGTEPAPYRIPQYANWQDIATTIRARGQA